MVLAVRQEKFGPDQFENFRCRMFWVDVFHTKWMKNVPITSCEDVFFYPQPTKKHPTDFLDAAQLPFKVKCYPKNNIKSILS